MYTLVQVILEYYLLMTLSFHNQKVFIISRIRYTLTGGSSVYAQSLTSGVIYNNSMITTRNSAIFSTLIGSSAYFTNSISTKNFTSTLSSSMKSLTGESGILAIYLEQIYSSSLTGNFAFSVKHFSPHIDLTISQHHL